MSDEDTWTPQYSPWRHGGWYVDNVRYPSGAVGCVSNNFPDKKWRIACETSGTTFPSRDAAARAERVLTLYMNSQPHRPECLAAVAAWERLEAWEGWAHLATPVDRDCLARFFHTAMDNLAASARP